MRVRMREKWREIKRRGGRESENMIKRAEERESERKRESSIN